MTEDKSFLEEGLPEYLRESIERMKIGWILRDADPSYTYWEGDFYELQSNINLAALGRQITTEQAWYLREKYLGIVECDEYGDPICKDGEDI